MPISTQYKCIFIHIPKNAGTSIEKVINTGTKECFYSNVVPTLQHLTWQELKSRIDFNHNNFFKFTVVRNPYERVISEYEWRKKVTPTLLEGRTFDNFVKDLDLLKSNIYWDRHLETQSFFLREKDGSIASDIEIFRYEEIEKLWDILMNITKIPRRLIPWALKTDKKLPEEYFTVENRQRIFDYYKEDFINFNYNE